MQVQFLIVHVYRRPLDRVHLNAYSTYNFYLLLAIIRTSFNRLRRSFPLVTIFSLIGPRPCFVCFQVGPTIDHRRHCHKQRQKGFDRQQLDDDDVYRIQRARQRVAVEFLSEPHLERSPGKSGLSKTVSSRRVGESRSLQ